ncbi:DUF6415 family natural product biosynthesis protein [Streptomyces levis]|uniref:DUF6415 family natural product biosynthesis protein n=1 Tax=Streptomyces levis TaxID=285566 RepID=UPI003C7B9994
MTSTETSPQAAGADPVPALIAEAFEAGRRYWPHERYVGLDKRLREEVERLVPIVQRRADRTPSRSRQWYASTNAIDAAQDALGFQMGTGPLAASLHVAELARRIIALREAAGIHRDDTSLMAPRPEIEPANPPEALSLGVIMRLNARTWIEQDEKGAPLPVLMLTYPPTNWGWTGPAAHTAHRNDAGPLPVEGIMRHVAASLNTVPPSAGVLDVGRRISLHGPEALLWFSGCPYALKISNPRWLRAADTAGRALLLVGLEELSPVASAAEVEEYRDSARAADRLHCALAHVGRPPQDAR